MPRQRPAATRDILDAVQTSVNPKVIDVPNAAGGSFKPKRACGGGVVAQPASSAIIVRTVANTVACQPWRRIIPACIGPPAPPACAASP